jgi:hypothetical protein
MHGEKRFPYKILVGKPEGKRSLGRPICSWENNIKMDLREIGWGGIHLAQGPVEGSYEYSNDSFIHLLIL